MALSSREAAVDVVYKTGNMKRREDLMKKVQERLNREKFERQYLPLPQAQLMKPLPVEVQ